jgi:DNA-binding beta-propeller fold protein YncE
VDVIDPPYLSITRTIGSGFVAPQGVSLNKKNKLAFVADVQNGTVTVVNYATGVNVTVLGPAQGLTSAFTVVDGPNAVY